MKLQVILDKMADFSLKMHYSQNVLTLQSILQIIIVCYFDTNEHLSAAIHMVLNHFDPSGIPSDKNT